MDAKAPAVKIGILDYYLSNWHADHYPAWIERYNRENGKQYRVAYAWAESEVSPVTGKTTDDWCREQGVEACATAEEVCEKSDVLMILAPSDPDKHLPYAGIALPYGKPTYIDKTFAPDTATAKAIFALATKYKTPFFSTSALRYAGELRDFRGAQSLTVTGRGRDMAEYIIHPIEMAVSIMGTGALRVRTESRGEEYRIGIDYGESRTATVLFSPEYPYGVEAVMADGRKKQTAVTSEYFYALLADICRFYGDGQLSFDPAETLEVAAVREAALKSRGEWVSLPAEV